MLPKQNPWKLKCDFDKIASRLDTQVGKYTLKSLANKQPVFYLCCCHLSVLCLHEILNFMLSFMTVCANPLETKTSAPWKGNGEVLIGTAGFPSLQELTARNITANTVPWMKCNLPVSLKGILLNTVYSLNMCSVLEVGLVNWPI